MLVLNSSWTFDLVANANNPNVMRMCVDDMCAPNSAIWRQTHVTPTAESKLKGDKIFSKLDLNYGYYQLELDEESRLRRYKRFKFWKILINILGVPNVSDEILMFGKK